MEKRIRNRILYVTVAGLWSVAIYRTWKNYEVKTESETNTVVNMPPVSPLQFQKDSFELILPESDPFLKEGWTPVVAVNVVKTEKPERSEEPTVVVAPQPKIWPRVEYYGFVKNRNQNSTLCLLKIDGRQLQLSQGEKHDGLLVLKTFRDSVQLLFEGEQKTVRK